MKKRWFAVHLPEIPAKFNIRFRFDAINSPGFVADLGWHQFPVAELASANDPDHSYN
jgi:hypothetical protein